MLLIVLLNVVTKFYNSQEHEEGFTDFVHIASLIIKPSKYDSTSCTKNFHVWKKKQLEDEAVDDTKQKVEGNLLYVVNVHVINLFLCVSDCAADRNDFIPVLFCFNILI